MSTSNGDPPEAEPDPELTADDTREFGTPRGTGQVPEEGSVDYEPNRHGRAVAMTVFSPVRPWYKRPWGGTLWLWLVFRYGRMFPKKSATIKELSFIHFARWIVIPRLPRYGQPKDAVGHPLLMFESNYNGTFDQYIDAFASILTDGMKQIWGTSYGFPGPEPVAPFKVYIRANEFTADHYYAAYPTATTTMVKSALALKEPLRDFTRREKTMPPAEFWRAYRAFLTEHQKDL